MPLTLTEGKLIISELRPEAVVSVWFEGQEDPAFDFTVANPLTGQGFVKAHQGQPADEFLSSIDRMSNGDKPTNRKEGPVIEIGQKLEVTRDTTAEDGAGETKEEVTTTEIIRKFGRLPVAKCKIWVATPK